MAFCTHLDHLHFKIFLVLWRYPQTTPFHHLISSTQKLLSRETVSLFGDDDNNLQKIARIISKINVFYYVSLYSKHHFKIRLNISQSNHCIHQIIAPIYQVPPADMTYIYWFRTWKDPMLHHMILLTYSWSILSYYTISAIKCFWH